MLRTLERWMRRRWIDGPKRRRQALASQPRQPWLECLEDRCVPAGNVLAAEFFGQLLLTGDDLGNSVHIADGSQPGEVVVTGVDGTTINGASAQVFNNIGSLFADLFSGDDTLQTENLTLAAFDFALVFIDGGAGDDRIDLVNTSIRASNSVDVQIFGEKAVPGFSTTGNDTIRLIGTTISAENGFIGFVNVDIYGEYNTGGEVLGGNDTIVVQDSLIRAASPGFLNILTFDLVGNYSAAQGGMTSVVGQGDDTITVSNTTITAVGSISNNTAVATVTGDYSEARSFPGGDAASSVGSGNDRITVKDSEVSAVGVSFASNFSRLDVRGDWALVEGSVDASATSTIGGGNDSITVRNTNVAAGGGFAFSQAIANIVGDFIQIFGPLGSARLSTIGGGSDSITVADTTITLDGSGGDFAGLVIAGERHENFDPAASVIGAGDDDVRIRNVQLIGHSFFDTRLAFISTDVGDDRLEVLDSSFGNFIAADLGDGDDTMKFNNNVVREASLTGGFGFDTLNAHDNVGLLIWFAFEDANVTP